MLGLFHHGGVLGWVGLVGLEHQRVVERMLVRVLEVGAPHAGHVLVSVSAARPRFQVFCETCEGAADNFGKDMISAGEVFTGRLMRDTEAAGDFAQAQGIDSGPGQTDGGKTGPGW